MVDYSVRSDVAFLEVNNPPVNALGYAVRVGLRDGVSKATIDPRVKAVIVCGQGRTFPAGADITEFSKPLKAPSLIEVVDALEACTKPVVAAIHGTALGGGLEVALGCHYRVALSTSRLGFPEVSLGILPGASGTQRLPRVTDLSVSLDLITSGRHVPAADGLRWGIVDRVVPGDSVDDLLKAATRLAREVSRDLSSRRISRLPVKVGLGSEAVFDRARMKVNKTARGVMAPMYCIKAVQAAVESATFQEGMKKESELLRILSSSGQARALQYAFFSQRAATKWVLPTGENASSVKPLSLKTGGVIGAGTMGAGIVMVLLNAGIPCTLIEQNQKFLDRGVQTITDLYAGSVRLGRMSGSQAQERLKLLQPTLNYQDLATVDFVIEAVFENMSLKKEVFAKLDRVCKPDALLCSNTSTLNVDEIASATSRPDKVVGTHFFAPAYYMQLLENIYGRRTSPQSVSTVMALGKRIGKVPVLVGNCNGFCGNRMMSPYTTEAQFCVEEGALPHEVDRVIEDFGIPIGPFKVSDMSGLDIGYKIRQEVFKNANGSHPLLRLGRRYCPLADALVERGRLGRKTGSGWYRYERPGAKVAAIDQRVTDLIVDHRKTYNIEQRVVGQQEIVERCLYSLINEGFKVLEDGIAMRPEEIDTIWLLGYGWPKQTGGPMFYANQIGLDQVYGRICHYNKHHPLSPHWTPSTLLGRLSRLKLPMREWTSLLPRATPRTSRL